MMIIWSALQCKFLCTNHLHVVSLFSFIIHPSLYQQLRTLFLTIASIKYLPSGMDWIKIHILYSTFFTVEGCYPIDKNGSYNTHYLVGNFSQQITTFFSDVENFQSSEHTILLGNQISKSSPLLLTHSTTQLHILFVPNIHCQIEKSSQYGSKNRAKFQINVEVSMVSQHSS